MRKITTLIFFIYLLHSTIYSQNKKLTVQQLTVKEGLSDNTINCILQDHSGFMWFGTNDGLNRYDGNNIKIFRPQNKFIQILGLCQTTDSLMYIATKNGLYQFNPVTLKFTHHYTHTHSKKNSLPSGRVSSVHSAQKGGLWITTNRGLSHIKFLVNPITKNRTPKFTNYHRDDTTCSKIPSENLTDLYEDNEGIVWISSMDPFLIRFDPSTGHFEKIQLINTDKQGSTPISILNIYPTNNNQLWLTSLGGGVIILNKKDLKCRHLKFNPHIKNTISHSDVYGISKDGDGNIWLGTWNGIDILNPDKLIDSTNPLIKHYNCTHPKFRNKLENRIKTLFFDRSGVMWIGTFSDGIVKVHMEAENFKHVQLKNKESLDDLEIKDIREDKQGYLWISTYYGGIKKSNQKAGTTSAFTFSQYKHDRYDKTSIASNIVLSSCRDKNENYWFALGKSGISFFNKKTKKFTNFTHSSKNPNSIPKGNIEKIFMDSKGSLWIGSSNGLIFLDPITKTFHQSTTLSNKLRSLNNNHVRSILEDSKGNIWIGTDRGLNKVIYHKQDSFKFKRFNDYYSVSEQFQSKEIWTLFEDSKGTLWIGYRGGLGKYNSNNTCISYYTTRDGLCNNFVTCITEDSKGNLWLGTNSGISQFNPSTEKFTNYYVSNNNRATLKDSKGNIYFGNDRGFIYFNPENFTKNHYITPAVISDLRIKNVTVPVGPDNKGHIILSKSINYTNKVTLRQTDNSFTIEFIGLSYLHQEKNKYTYKLQNYDDHWILTDSKTRSVTYNNLKPDTYHFLVKASNNDEIWNNKITSLEITILPPWWETWIFRILLTLLIIFILFSIYKYRVNKIIEAQKLAIHQTKLKNTLKISRIKNKKEKELNNMKTRFFMNISHELRTPLTLIMAPIKEIIKNSKQDQEIKNKLLTINQNALQLNTLINQILDFRKIETNETKLLASNGDIVRYTESVFNTFKELARIGEINYTFHSYETKLDLWFDSSKINSILSNLLSNAFKYTPNRGSISLSVGYLWENPDNKDVNYCKISIKDNGKGIAPKYQDKIFNRFYQVPDSDSVTKTGAGIGLCLVKEFVNLHKGTIEVKSKKNEGTEFIIQLPLGKKHLNPNEILELNKNIIFNSDNDTNIIPLDTEMMKEEIIQEPRLEDPLLLIVEDNLKISTYIKDLFAPHYRTLMAKDGREGNVLALKHLPNIIICDIMMPKMNGIELCHILKTTDKTRHIPIILLTAKTSSADKLEGITNGADEYISKPFDPILLKAKVNNLINSRRQLKEYYSKTITLEPTNLEVTTFEEEFLQKTIQIIEQNLQNAKFNAIVLATQLNMSQSTLYRKIKAYSGLSINGFIRSIRLKRAAQLLHLNKYSISEISELIGFNDTAYFRKCFIKQYGVTPSNFHKKNQ